MVGNVVIAVVSLAAVVFPVGRLVRAYRFERERERALDAQEAALNEISRLLLSDNTPSRVPLTEYDRGFLEGVGLRRGVDVPEPRRIDAPVAHVQ